MAMLGVHMYFTNLLLQLFAALAPAVLLSENFSPKLLVGIYSQ